MSAKNKSHRLVLFTAELNWVELNPNPNRQNMGFRTADRTKITAMKRTKFGVKRLVAMGISR